jgi:hypothetical protein
MTGEVVESFHTEQCGDKLGTRCGWPSSHPSEGIEPILFDEAKAICIGVSHHEGL